MRGPVIRGSYGVMMRLKTSSCAEEWGDGALGMRPRGSSGFSGGSGDLAGNVDGSLEAILMLFFFSQSSPAHPETSPTIIQHKKLER